MGVNMGMPGYGMRPGMAGPGMVGPGYGRPGYGAGMPGVIPPSGPGAAYGPHYGYAPRY